MKRTLWISGLTIVLFAGVIGLALAQGPVVMPGAPSKPAMTAAQAMVLGIVEGLTEYLPISSTGHLYITQHFLGLNAVSEAASNAYAICIQLGAILAVLVLYFGRIRRMVLGVLGRDPEGRRLAGYVLVAFLPAAVVGVLAEKYIKSYLFGLLPVIAAWLVGGMIVLLIAQQRRQRPPDAGDGLEGLTLKGALLIGVIQCVAMWPGVSRSLTTIVAGTILGLSIPAAVEFSFLLGFVTLGAATLYEGIKEGPLMVQTFGMVTPLIGLAVSCLAAVVSVKWMVGYLNRHGIALFGYYRITLALIALVFIIFGILK